MIRVLQIVPTLGYGGVAQFLLNYYRRMQGGDIIFDFVTHGGVEDFHQELISAGSQIHYLKPISQIGIISYVKSLGRVISKGDYDIIHTHDGHMTGVTAMFCKMYFKGPIIAHAHTTLCPNPSHRPFMPLFRIMSRVWASKLVACGKEAGKYLFGKGAKFTVIHNAVSIERFQNVSEERINELREKFGIRKDDYIIGHVGLFTPPKNHFFIINMFARLCSQDDKAKLVLVGGGDLVEDIKKLATELNVSDRIVFTGKQSDIPAFMHLFDVFILPSLFEGLPVVAIEAQAAGTPTILSDVIDHDVDAHLGIVDFLPIGKQYYQEWITKILCKKQRADEPEIRLALCKAGYEIGNSVNSLVDIYNNINA